MKTSLPSQSENEEKDELKPYQLVPVNRPQDMDADDRALQTSCAAKGLSYLSMKWCQDALPLEVLRSGAGCYIGSMHPTEGPSSRDSVRYWGSRTEAEAALSFGTWIQRVSP